MRSYLFVTLIGVSLTLNSCSTRFLDSKHVDDISSNANTNLSTMIVDKLKNIPTKLTKEEDANIENKDKLFEKTEGFKLNFSKLLKAKGSDISDTGVEYKRKIILHSNSKEINERNVIQSAKRRDSYQKSMDLDKFEEIYAIKLIHLLKQESCSRNANLKYEIRKGVIDCLRQRNFHIDWRVKFTPTSKLIIQDSVCYNRMGGPDIMSIVAKDRQCIIDNFNEGKFISPLNLINNKKVRNE